MPMQYTEILKVVKVNFCSRILFYIFLIFSLNIACGTHKLCFGAKNQETNRYTPAYPSFFYIKVGFKGVYISRTCFSDD